MFTGLNRLEANKGDLHGQDGSNAVHLSKVNVIFVKREGFVNKFYVCWPDDLHVFTYSRISHIYPVRESAGQHKGQDM